MTVVNWVSELKNENGVGVHLFELFFELSWRFSVMIEPVVPDNFCQLFDFTADQPVTGWRDMGFDVWVFAGTD